MKCPFCGNDEFIEIDNPDQLPFTYSEQYLDSHLQPKSAFACSKCGYVVFFNKTLLESRKAKFEEISSLKKDIESYQEKIKYLNEHPYADDVEERIKKYKKEINQLNEMGIGGKELRSREECLKELETIFANGFDPSVKADIKRYEDYVATRQKKIDDIQNDLNRDIVKI